MLDGIRDGGTGKIGREKAEQAGLVTAGPRLFKAS